MKSVSILLFIIEISVSLVASETSPSIPESTTFESTEPAITAPSGPPPISPRCSKTMKRLYGPSGDGETYLGDYSWMVALGYQEINNTDVIFRCGGALIADRWVLTAAQCVTGLGNSELVKIRIGDLNLDTEKWDGVTPIDGVLDEVKVHPDYKVDLLPSDIALIRLKVPVPDTSSIHPICLLSGPEFTKDEYYDGKSATILGFGVFKVGGGLSKKLLEGTVKVVKPVKCNEKYAALRNDDTVEPKYASLTIGSDSKFICAGDTDQSACEGDVGGPIVFIDPKENRHYVGGIISGIYKCGIGYPNIFTKVAAFITWINEVTGENFS